MSSVELPTGITIEYETHGDGEPLLLVMGLNGQLTDWHPELIEIFVALGYQVIRFDNREIGLSTELDWQPPSIGQGIRNQILRKTPEAPYTIEDMADDAAGLLRHLSIDRAHVLGVSMGGMISQALAINHPQLVASLCSIMSNTGDSRRGKPSASLLGKIARLGTATRETAADHSVKSFALFAGEGFVAEDHRQRAQASVDRSWRPLAMPRQATAIGASPDRTARLGSVVAPTVVIHGLADPLVQPSGGLATAEAVPGSRLLMFPEMGHYLPRHRWDECLDAISTNTRRAPLR